MMQGPEFVALRAAAGMFPINGLDESNSVNTDWQDLFYRTGIVTNHDLGVSGGTKTGNYKFDLGYYKDEAVVPRSDYSRFSIRGGLDQKIGKFLRFGFTTNSNSNITNGSDLGLSGVLSMTPIAYPYNKDGTLKRIINMVLDQGWVYTRDGINNLGDQWKDQTKVYGSYNSLYGELKIPGIEGLKYRINLGADYRKSNTDKYTGEGVFSSYYYNPSSTSGIESDLFSTTVENLLSYDLVFAQKHRLNAIVLYSVEKTTYNYDNKVFNSNDQSYKSGFKSLMGRVMYSYDDLYMVSATLRYDASLESALTKKHQTSPAVSLGWNLTKESFMKDITAIDALKLRAGYGQVSPDLGLENSVTTNVGLDFSILKGRLTGTAEYYATKTKDIVLSIALTGNTVLQNVGATQNKGWELSLNSIIFDNLNGWTWEAGVNVYSNKNKLAALSSGQKEDQFNWLFVGHPLNVIYDYKKTGLWQAGDANLQKYEPGGNIGMIKVLYTGTYNADGSPTRAIGPEDRQIIDCDPDFQGGFNTRVTYKRFDLSVVGNFQKGGILNSTLYGSASYLNLENGRRGQIDIDYWTPTNTGAKYPRPDGITSNNNPMYGNTLGYFDGTYLKINTVTLGYSFNSKWIKKTGIEKLRVYGTLQNPIVLFSPYHKESGLDPETNSYGNDNSNMAVATYPSSLLVVGYNTPSTHNFLVGVNVIF